MFRLTGHSLQLDELDESNEAPKARSKTFELKKEISRKIMKIRKKTIWTWPTLKLSLKKNL